MTTGGATEGREVGARDRFAMPNLTFKSRLADVPAIHARIVADAEAAGFADQALFAIRLATEEALVNAVRHGNQKDETKDVEVTWTVDADRFEIRIRDEGPGFDPDDVPDPTADENLARPCGRGVLLMRAYMDEVAFHGRGNEVHLVKHRAAAEAEDPSDSGPAGGDAAPGGCCGG